MDFLHRAQDPMDSLMYPLLLIHPNQPWDFFGRNDAKAETPVLWPPHAKNWLIGKDFDAGRDWGQEKKGTAEDEMAGWHHWLNGCESEWTPGVGDGQRGLACCNSWGRKESDMTEWLNWTELEWFHNVVTILSTTGLYTLGWLIVCYMNTSKRMIVFLNESRRNIKY